MISRDSLVPRWSLVSRMDLTLRRAFAVLLDLIVFVYITIAVDMVMGVFGADFDTVYQWRFCRMAFGDDYLSRFSFLAGLVTGLPLIAYTVGHFLYAVIFLWLRGATPGMAFVQIRLVHRTGSRPTLLATAFRQLCSLASFWCLTIGCWWMLIDRRGRAWHDLASGTEIVRTDVPTHCASSNR